MASRALISHIPGLLLISLHQHYLIVCTVVLLQSTEPVDATLQCQKTVVPIVQESSERSDKVYTNSMTKSVYYYIELLSHVENKTKELLMVYFVHVIC